MSDWKPPEDWPEHWKGWERGEWRRGRFRGRRYGRPGHPRFLFFRFISLFGMIVLLVLAGMAGVAFLLTNFFGGEGQTAVAVWLAGCCLSIALPLLAVFISVRTFRGIATPLSDVMAAADAVAEGDFSVRVEEERQGDFGQLSRSFNRMAGELERAEQQRRNLTADIAHELRTPLHIIQGNLEGILDGVYEPTAEHINMTLDETRLLARLVEDLRTLSLAEAGQLPLVIEPVNIGELLADVQTSFSGQAEAAGIDLRLALDGQRKAMIVSGDIGRLDQVLTNLVANAIRHTKTGGQVTLSAEMLDGGVRIQVRDNGEGIDAADIPYIFDRFWRADRARPHSDGAVGLGLAIARQLVRAHDGKIEVESDLGVGTTFTIYLPMGRINPII